MQPTESGIFSAWLEKSDGTRIPIRGTCSIGRAPSNEIVLTDDKVSRRHAFVHVQEQTEYWLVDLGSSNGTYLNGRRISQPIRVRDQDKIGVSKFQLTFRQHSTTVVMNEQPTQTTKTIQDIKSSDCWLLVADIAGSTQLGKSLSAEELPMVTGRWLAECKEIIEECGGSINKFLGDGFLAYWHDHDRTVAGVVRALEAFKRLQAVANPVFRVVLHRGQVFVGGVVSMGEESLLGKEVNFVFRMEKLAASLHQPTLLSEGAQGQIQPLLPTTEIGWHKLPGFEGEFPFFRC